MQRINEKKPEATQSHTPEEFISSLEQKIKARDSAKDIHTFVSNTPAWMLNAHIGEEQRTVLHRLIELLWSNPTLNEPVLDALNLLCQLGADPEQQDYHYKSAIDYTEQTQKFSDEKTATAVKDIIISANNENSYLDGYGTLVNPYSIDKRFDESEYGKNLRHAFNAIRYIRNIVCIGAPNNIKDAKRTSHYSESIYQKMLDELKGLMAANPITETVAPFKIYMAQLAKKYRVGCCFYQSALAFEYLWKLGVNAYNIELTTTGGYRHHLVAISLSKKMDFSNPSTWDKNVIFCDPWTMSVYPAEYRKYQEFGLFNYLQNVSRIFSQKQYAQCYESTMQAYERYQEAKSAPLLPAELASSIKNPHRLFYLRLDRPAKAQEDYCSHDGTLTFETGSANRFSRNVNTL